MRESWGANARLEKGASYPPLPCFPSLALFARVLHSALMNSSSSLLGFRNLHIFINNIYGINLFWFESLKPELLILIAVCPDYGNDSETEK